MGIESYNPSASLNSTLGGKNVAEGMARGDVSDSIRQLMADIASGVVPTVNVKTYGAVGDGVTNDRAAFVLAVAAARGKRLVIPEGNYLINSDGGSISLEEVALVGEGPLDGATAAIDQGTNIYITGTTNSPFKVRRGTVVSGIGFYYPNQADSASPAAYPATFDFDFGGGAVQFVQIHGNVVYNAYKFIDINDVGGNVGHVDVTGNFICALNRGIYIRHNAEHIRIRSNNFTFGHWLAATEAGARGYMRANATAVQADQSDGIEFYDNLVFGHLNGLLTSALGLCQFMNVSLNKLDNCRYPIKATGAGNFDGSIIGNTFNSYNSVNNTLQGRSISIETAGSGFESITIAANNFDVATEDHVYVTGNSATRKVLIGNNNFRSWAAYKAAGAYGAINASGSFTNVQVNGGWFFGSNNAAYSNGVMGNPNTAQVTGATFEGCLAALNITSNHVTTAGNRSFSTGGATSDVITATTCFQAANAWDKPSNTSTSPAFLARKNASQTFNSGTATDVAFGSEIFDKGGDFATPTFTAPRAGRYRFTYGLLHDATGTAGDRWTHTLTTSTGQNFGQSYIMIASVNSIAGDAFLQLVAGETVKLQIARVGGAGQLVTFNDANFNHFAGHLVD